MAPTRPIKPKATRYSPSTGSDGTRLKELPPKSNCYLPSLPEDEEYITSPSRLLKRRKPVIRKSSPNCPVIPPNQEYECISTIAGGATCEVALVRKNKNKEHPTRLYAVKITRKAWYRRYEVEASLPNGRNPETTVQRRQEKNNERRALTTLPWHPFVVGIVDAFDDRRNLYHVLELGAYGTFGTFIKGCTYSTDECRFYFLNIVIAIEFIHKFGVVHRDIKPDNILVGGDGYLMLTDFGNAKMLPSDGPWDEMGTLHYLAPECLDAECDPQYAPGLDWWAAACILFEMVTGKKAFPLRGEDTDVATLDLRQNVKYARYLWPKERKVDSELRHLVDGMLARDTQSRIPFLAPKAGHYGSQAKSSLWDHLFLIEPYNYTHSVKTRTAQPPHIPEYQRDLSKNWLFNGAPCQEEIPGLPIAIPPIEQAYDIRSYYSQNPPKRMMKLLPNRKNV
ncbi:hypothetical protein QCA50_003548 [Cerrena zonata]|uniref:non-specific serine/threonine protein kinase n=1 Tax=Cerrena zonata TaxID=2478898 RepID=A0AAW0GK47_9APHY